MVATLFTMGITLFLVGTGMMVEHVRSHGRSPLMLFLPLLSSSYISQFWSDVWLPALLRALGLVATFSALALAVAQDPLLLRNPLKVLKPAPPANVLVGTFHPAGASAQQQHGESIRWAIRNSPEPRVSGRLMGANFVYDTARLLNGTLQLQQGVNFYGDTEVRLLLGLDVAGVGNNYLLTVHPGQPDAPEVQVSRYDPVTGTMKTRVYRDNYSLELSLGRVGQDAFQGYMELILPGEDMNYVAGQMVVRTNQLRYVNDRVDLTFDHPETLEYVAWQYVETQYPNSVLSAISFTDTEILYGQGLGTTVVTLTLLNGRQEERKLLFDRSEIGWAVRPGAMEMRVLQEAQEGAPRIVMTGSSPRQQPVATTVPDPVTVPFERLVDYVGQRAQVHQTDGRMREGVVRGIQRQRLVVESVVQSGLVEFSFAERDIGWLVLATGQRIDVEREQPASAEVSSLSEALEPPSASEATVPREPDAVADVADDGDALLATYQALLGREVTVLTHDGRSRSGTLRRVSPQQVVLVVMMDGGSLEYIYDLTEIAEVRPR